MKLTECGNIITLYFYGTSKLDQVRCFVITPIILSGLHYIRSGYKNAVHTDEIH